MLIKISEDSAQGNYQDRGRIVDAILNQTHGNYIYIDSEGIMWDLFDDGTIEVLNVYAVGEINGH